MITPVDNVNFRGKLHFNGFSKHTPKARQYEEFHFMPELQKKNPIKEFVKSIKKAYQDYCKQKAEQRLWEEKLWANMSPEERERFYNM